MLVGSHGNSCKECYSQHCFQCECRLGGHSTDWGALVTGLLGMNSSFYPWPSPVVHCFAFPPKVPTLTAPSWRQTPHFCCGAMGGLGHPPAPAVAFWQFTLLVASSSCLLWFPLPQVQTVALISGAVPPSARELCLGAAFYSLGLPHSCCYMKCSHYCVLKIWRGIFSDVVMRQWIFFSRGLTHFLCLHATFRTNNM